MVDTVNDLQQLAVQAAAEKKAFDILVLDLRNRSDLTDYFVICSGNSRMQVQAIADSVLDEVYQSAHRLSSIEGYTSGNWVVLDLIDVVVHIFHKDIRVQYDLERLWGDVPVIEVACQELGILLS
ncbi:MAG: ribosome silencing factor [Nitrospinaceae bacterium]|jgi:ribosome-associated protein|nr:ribosome silencing factor [Nitrospinaceae bacterium]